MLNVANQPNRGAVVFVHRGQWLIKRHTTRFALVTSSVHRDAYSLSVDRQIVVKLRPLSKADNLFALT
jgi:hypothetical protein